MIKYTSRNYRSLVLITTLVGLTACSTMNTVENAQSAGQRQMVCDKRILTDAGLNRHVNVVGINEATVSTGFKKVQIELLNKTSSDYRFRYLVEWFDDKGMLVQSPTSGWVERTISGKEALDIISIAPTESAKDFRVKFLSN